MRSSGVQEFRSSGVQEFRSSGVQEFRSSAWGTGRVASKKAWLGQIGNASSWVHRVWYSAVLNY
jgi:hypothetical protein